MIAATTPTGSRRVYTWNAAPPAGVIVSPSILVAHPA
jgi:hypothetical protein